MKDVHETEIFRMLDSKNNIRLKVESNIKKNMVNLNSTLMQQIEGLSRLYPDALSPKVIQAIRDGRIILYYTPETDKLPIYYPFVKFKDNGVPKMAIDLTNFTDGISKDRVTGELNVKIQNVRLYCLAASGYLYLTVYPTKDSTLTPTLMRLTSNLWAKLFCNVLTAKAGLGTNKDRYDAFMYFAQKYFLINILEAPAQTAEDIAMMQFRNKMLNPTARQIAEACSSRGIEMYTNLMVFCDTIFNADITGLRTIKINSTGSAMTFDAFVRNYIAMYYAASGLSLAAFPSFMWMLMSSCYYAFIFKDSVIEKICLDDFSKIMVEVYRMV